MITDSISPNACITGSLDKSRHDISVGMATVVDEGASATLTLTEKCPDCQAASTMVWSGTISGDTMSLTGTQPDPHASGCGVYEHPTSMTLRLARTANGWTGTRTNEYVLLSDVTLAPLNETVVDTLAVSLTNAR